MDAGTLVVATATDASGNTSENSAAITAAPVSATTGAIISEFRFHGQSGTADEYVELRNKINGPLDISGWSIQTRTATGLQTTVVPANTIIPVFGHYLFTGSAYSLTGYGTSDQSLAGDILDDSGAALFNAAGAVQDAAGFTTSSDAALKEGAGLPSAPNVDGEYALMRNFVVSQEKDSGDNASDFILVSTTGAAVAGTSGNIPATLGAPSPEGLTSPFYANNLLTTVLVDTTSGATVNTAPNREILPGSTTGGDPRRVILVRRTITNNSGRTVTRLRFGVTSITTLGTLMPTGAADVRLVSSDPMTVTRRDGTTVNLSGLTFEAGGVGQASQPLGGGLGSSVVLLDVPILPGQSRSYTFKLFIERGGNYSIALNVLALLGP